MDSQHNGSRFRKAAGAAAGAGFRALAKSPIFWAVIGCIAALLIIVVCAYAVMDQITSRAAAAAAYESSEEGYLTGTALPLSEEVEAYRDLVYQEAAKYGKEEYTDLFLAVMQVESGGTGTTDVFQCSESLGLARNSLTVTQSITQGVRLLCGYLDSAGVTSVSDITNIRLALQGYNFGNGYISYALEKDGGWTQDNVDSFAMEQHNKNPSTYPLRTGTAATRMGKWGYGDQYYTDHVLQYYPYAYSSQYETAAGAAGTTDPDERLDWLFDGHVPTSSSQMSQWLVKIQVPVVDTKGNQSTCTLTVHKKLANDIYDCFYEMARIGFPVKASDTSCYNWRLMRGGSSLSHHSYGSAIDVNASSNPQVANKSVSCAYKPGVDPYSVTSQVVAIWKDHGFYWGGDWNSRTDYMHFTFCDH